MKNPNRFGTAMSAIAMAAVLSGCAAGGGQRESMFGSKVDHSNIGLATRAQAALEAEQFDTAVNLAERAVDNSPSDAGFRGLLGNSYFAAGRFASAEAAYRDSLTLLPEQPKVVLKLALVQIAQGRSNEAAALLDAARAMLDPADYGLAMALAGRAADAVVVLNDAARTPGADARVRQNLALAYGLSGDWTMARVVAEQDVAPDQVDSRIQQWMAMATPTTASQQVAALTGVKPAASDPGQPQRLALKGSPRSNEAYAEAVVPHAAPQQLAQPVAEQAIAVAPQPVAELPPVAAPEPMPQAAPVPVKAVVAEVATPPVPELPTRFDTPVEPAKYVAITETVRRAAASAKKAPGRSNAVVQLGAYKSPQGVTEAWTVLTKRYPALKSYTPMRARFDGPKGTVWRLSVKGFASRQEAVDRCERLQGRGGNCFVRMVAGDAPVQLASR